MLGVLQFSCLMQIMISSAVFLSFNLNFYQLYLFETLIRPLPLHYLSISPSSLCFPALLGAMLGYCLRYCKTPSRGSPGVRGEAGCLI